MTNKTDILRVNPHIITRHWRVSVTSNEWLTTNRVWSTSYLSTTYYLLILQIFQGWIYRIDLFILFTMVELKKNWLHNSLDSKIVMVLKFTFYTPIVKQQQNIHVYLWKYNKIYTYSYEEHYYHLNYTFSIYEYTKTKLTHILRKSKMLFGV